jgi:putative aldouronate transport system permease protein
MWHRKLFYRLIIITMYFNAGLIPWYMNMRALGFLDNFWLTLSPSWFPLQRDLVKTFIENVPPSLEESAHLDGAVYIVSFTKVILPLIIPIMATLAIFSAGSSGTASWIPWCSCRGKNYTLQYVLYKYQNEASALAAMMRTTQDTPRSPTSPPSRPRCRCA